MSKPQSPGLSRRTLFTAAGLGAVAALAGCTSDGDDGQSATATPSGSGTAPGTASDSESNGPTPDSDASANALAHRTTMLGLVFTTRLHIAHLEQAIAIDTEDSATFATLLGDRKAHLKALTDDYRRVFNEDVPAAASQTPSSDPSSDSFPADRDQILGILRGDATTAQNTLTDALMDSSAYQAQLYGSIAACVATHRKVLGAMST